MGQGRYKAVVTSPQAFSYTHTGGINAQLVSITGTEEEVLCSQELHESGLLGGGEIQSQDKMTEERGGTNTDPKG